MRDRVAATLKVSTFLMVFSGYLALVSVRDYSASLLLLPLALLFLTPFGEWLERRSGRYARLSRVAVILYTCFIPLSVYAWGILDAVIALVIFVQVYSLLHHKAEENYYHIFLMSFFLLLAACAQAPEPSIAFALLLFLFGASWAFMSLRLHVGNQAGLAAPADILALHTRSSRVPAEAGSPFDAGLIFSVSLVSFLGMALTAGIFMATPRIEAGFLGRADTGLSKTGISHSVDVRRGGLILQDQRAVMHVAFPEEPGQRYDGPLYWRITTLPKYDHSQWNHQALSQTHMPEAKSLLNSSASGQLDVRRRHINDLRLVHQFIYMDEVPDDGLPCLNLVQRAFAGENLRNTTLSWGEMQDFTILFRSPASRRLSYNVWSEVNTPPPTTLQAQEADYANSMPSADYRLLTHQDLLDATLESVQRVVEGARTNYDKVLAIQTWLSGPDFRYTTAVPALPPDNPMDGFINTVRAGHCQLFASAMALMVRSLGIPARVVSGFRGGEWNALDQSYTVRASMAHLWVEVLFPKSGWVVFDPSPQADLQPAGLRRLTTTLSTYLLRAKMFWYEHIIRYDSRLPFARLRDLSLGWIRSFWTDTQTTADDAHGVRSISPRRVLWLSLTLLGLSMLALTLRRLASRRGQPLLTEDQTRAVHLYLRLRRRLQRRGVDMTGKTSAMLLSELSQRGAQGIDQAELILRTYHGARFGNRPLSHSHFVSLKRALRALRLP